MYYGEIKQCDIANGYGVRTSLFVSGCRNHCPGCFQPETWDFEYGQPYTEDTRQFIIDSLRPDYVNGLSVLGGDPVEPENLPEVEDLIHTVKEIFGEKKNVWVYTGYLYENLLMKQSSILEDADVLVDGPFVEDEKNISLPFCGSRNQRVIDLKKTTDKDHIVLWRHPDLDI